MIKKNFDENNNNKGKGDEVKKDEKGGKEKEQQEKEREKQEDDFNKKKEMVREMKTDQGNMYLISARDTTYIDKHRKDGTKPSTNPNYNGIPFSKNLYYFDK